MTFVSPHGSGVSVSSVVGAPNIGRNVEDFPHSVQNGIETILFSLVREEARQRSLRNPLVELDTVLSVQLVLPRTMKIQDKLFPFGGIHGVVRPDLPEVHPLLRIGASLVGTGQKRPSLKGGRANENRVLVSRLELIDQMESEVLQSRCWRVQTVAAQLRSRKEINHRLVTSAQSVHSFGSGGSLLLVSGGHPLRKLPLVEPILPGNSLDMLKTACQLRKFGDIPPGVKMWAVENPLANSIERLEQKICAGAETVILQPPLLVDRFAEWWDGARTRGLIQAARVVVGLPLITSAKNLAFWFDLTQTSGTQVDAKLAHLKKVEADHQGDENGLATYYKAETTRLICYIKSLPDVGGIHFMPVTASGWRQFARLQEEQSL